MRLCSVVGELGEKARPSSGEGEERQGPGEKGMERREECKDRENPGKQHRWPGATQQMGGSSSPTCAAPPGGGPTQIPRELFLLWEEARPRRSREANSGWGGNTRGSVLSPGWPRRGQAGARRRCLSSRSLLGSDAAEAGGGEHPMPRMSWGSRGLHPADDGDKSERRPVFAGSAASWGAGFQGSRCPFGL